MANYFTDSNGRVWSVCSALDVYNKVNDLIRTTQTPGAVSFSLGGHTIKAKTRDIIGNLIENWVRDWMEAQDIYCLPNPNSQEAPDVFLLPDSSHRGWLEIKAFYGNANFDIADFIPFARDLDKSIWQLDEDILIFQYDMNEATGDVTIVNIFLKKMWQICGYCKERSIKVQAKNGQINKIRPVAWYANNAEFKPFPTIEAFLSAVKALYFDIENDLGRRTTWTHRVEHAYYAFYGQSIRIPEYSLLEEVDKSYSQEKKAYLQMRKIANRDLRQLKKEKKELAREMNSQRSELVRQEKSGAETSVLSGIREMLSDLDIRLSELENAIRTKESAISEYEHSLESIDKARRECAERLVY